jgi:hypothetical protein
MKMEHHGVYSILLSALIMSMAQVTIWVNFTDNFTKNLVPLRTVLLPITATF